LSDSGEEVKARALLSSPSKGRGKKRIGVPGKRKWTHRKTKRWGSRDTSVLRGGGGIKEGLDLCQNSGGGKGRRKRAW